MRPGLPEEQRLRSVANVDELVAVAERGQHRLAHIAGAGDTGADQADAKAEADVVMMEATTEATAEAEGLRRSGSRGQRGSADGGGGNETESKLTNHSHSPERCAVA